MGWCDVVYEGQLWSNFVWPDPSCQTAAQEWIMMMRWWWWWRDDEDGDDDDDDDEVKLWWDNDGDPNLGKF